MEAVFAVIVGLVAGTGLALLVALPLRRRRRARTGEVQPLPARRLLLSSAPQRYRAALIASTFAAMSTVSMMAGWLDSAAMFMIGTLVLGLQSVAGLAVERRTAEQ